MVLMDLIKIASTLKLDILIQQYDNVKLIKKYDNNNYVINSRTSNLFVFSVAINDVLMKCYMMLHFISCFYMTVVAFGQLCISKIHKQVLLNLGLWYHCFVVKNDENSKCCDSYFLSEPLNGLKLKILRQIIEWVSNTNLRSF